MEEMKELEDELTRCEEEYGEAAMTQQDADNGSKAKRRTHMDDSHAQWEHEEEEEEKKKKK